MARVGSVTLALLSRPVAGFKIPLGPLAIGGLADKDNITRMAYVCQALFNPGDLQWTNSRGILADAPTSVLLSCTSIVCLQCSTCEERVNHSTIPGISVK